MTIQPLSAASSAPASQPENAGGTVPSPSGNPLTSHQLAAAALKLFRAGKNTFEIASELNIREARASKLLWVARCQARQLPADYLADSGAVRRVLA